MAIRRRLGALVVILAVGMTGELFACGDKFLVGGRGTRYQRPKNARAASVLIYADPASAVAASLKKAKVESLLKLEGHKATKVQTLDELSNVVTSGRYDVILTANSDSANVQRMLATGPDAAVVVGVDDLVKNKTLLQAIDKAVVQRDEKLKKTLARSS
jgi:DNA-binding NarL/FixJ family response regulator